VVEFEHHGYQELSIFLLKNAGTVRKLSRSKKKMIQFIIVHAGSMK